VECEGDLINPFFHTPPVINLSTAQQRKTDAIALLSRLSSMARPELEQPTATWRLGFGAICTGIQYG
jgi:hypothetical protein